MIFIYNSTIILNNLEKIRSCDFVYRLKALLTDSGMVVHQNKIKENKQYYYTLLTTLSVVSNSATSYYLAGQLISSVLFSLFKKLSIYNGKYKEFKFFVFLKF